MRTAALTASVCALLLPAACGDDDDAGQVVRGSSYEVTVPEGWDDESGVADEVEELAGIRPELALAGKRADGFATNVNVIRGKNPPVGLDEQTRNERDFLEGVALSTDPVERTTLDGHEARVHEFELVQDDGRTTRIRQVFARNDGWTYFVTYTALPQYFDEELDEFDAILRSWEWR